jgi:hypothetical protein
METRRRKPHGPHTHALYWKHSGKTGCSAFQVMVQFCKDAIVR